MRPAETVKCHVKLVHLCRPTFRQQAKNIQPTSQLFKPAERRHFSASRREKKNRSVFISLAFSLQCPGHFYEIVHYLLTEFSEAQLEAGFWLFFAPLPGHAGFALLPQTGGRTAYSLYYCLSGGLIPTTLKNLLFFGNLLPLT